MTELVVAPDAEAVAIRALRASPELTVLVGTRIYALLPPAPKTFPALRVTQIYSVELTPPVPWLVEAWLQIDAWGGTTPPQGQPSETRSEKAVASDLARLSRAVLAAAEGSVDDELGAVVSAVNLGMAIYRPDPGFEPARPRYVYDLRVNLHPLTSGWTLPPATVGRARLPAGSRKGAG